MKKIAAVSMILFATMNISMANSGLRKLEALQGQYEVVDTSDVVCVNLKSFNLEVIGDDVVLSYERQSIRHGLENEYGSETIKDVNTRKYTSYNSLSAIIYKRNIFKQQKLITQEAAWAFGIVPSRYKDQRVVLEVVDSETLIYNLPYYGTATCELRRL